MAHLRAMAGADCDDPFLLELVDEFSLASENFRRLWARHDVRIRSHETVHIRHRYVGDLTLHFEAFNVNSAPGQTLVIGQPDPDSPSAHALAELGWLASTSR
ncbi:hypothetical protein Pth03_08180 [Planotetraspora thailandica]|uniref:MmyB-like transcription regulator ligand binding domain-containing protein n=1 Tax=Planotetraspora thailandica TaxID=487172 RepID=A0A8J3XTQ9_9ACTN|nr:hypothetical protein Pth03_08180 [Planotetraspora thailandica]